MKFRLLPKVGDHASPGPGGTTRIYHAGDVVESDINLKEMFPGKFEEWVEEIPSLKPTKEQKEAVQKAAEKGAEEIASKPESKPETKTEPRSLGRDVTSRFPLAEEQDCLVFADGGAFNVVEKDDPTMVLNDKPLKRKDVEPFIRQFLEG